MSSSVKQPKAAYDPTRKWGLLPASGLAPGATRTSTALGGGATYVMPGVVVSAQRDKLLSEVMGREKHAKSKRKADERELEKLLANDGSQSTGARAVVMARQAIATQHAASSKGKAKGKLTASEIAATINPASSKSSKSRSMSDQMKKMGKASGDSQADEVKLVSIVLSFHS